MDRLVEACADAEYVGAVLRAESWRRALIDSDARGMEEFGGAVRGWLRRL
jgi:hypothetical protein